MPNATPTTAAAPDGGWGWLVLTGGFVIYFINDGIESSFGLLASEIIRQLGVNRQSAGWIISVKTACMYFVCPLSAVVCHYLDARIVGTIAALLSFLGLFAASFASQHWHFFITIGLVTGPGVGTCFFLTIVMTCIYFNRLRATASGIVLCGSGLGGLVINQLLSLLIKQYGWQGSLLLLSALYLNNLPCCLLFRPLTVPAPEKRKSQSEASPPGRQTSSDSCVDGDTQPQPPPLTVAAPERGKSQSETSPPGRQTSSDSCVDGDTQPQPPPPPPPPPQTLQEEKEEEPPAQLRDAHNPEAATSASRPAADEGGEETVAAAAAVSDIALAQEAARRRWRQLRMASWLGDSLLLPIVPWPSPFATPSPSPPQPQPSAGNNASDSKGKMGSACMAACSRLRHCRNPRLLAFHASRTLLAAAAPTLYAYSADRGLQMGLSTGQASVMMSVLCACNMAGRLLFGCLGDRAILPPLAFYGGALMAAGAFTAGSLTAKGFASLAGLMGPACCFMGGAVSLTTLVAVHLDGTHRLFYVFARQSIFQGVGVLIGAPAAGAIFDVTGNYKATFAAISALLASSGLIALAIHWTTVGRQFKCCCCCSGRGDRPAE